MSVKSKVKRCNEEILRLEKQVEELKIKNKILANKESVDKILLENIVKFAITNHIGGIRGGMAIDWFGIDKMKDLKLDIEKNPIEHAYIIRVYYNC